MAKRAASPHRKLIAFDAETWMALDLLAQDRMASIQELADEAFADLLKKHHRPTTLKAALRESGRITAGAETTAPRTAPARKRTRRS
jgi:hypothetical protein